MTRGIGGKETEDYLRKLVNKHLVVKYYPVGLRIMSPKLEYAAIPQA